MRIKEPLNQQDTPENIQIICFTDAGQALARRLAADLPAGVHRSSRQLPVRAWTKQYFDRADALIYIGAAGIAVRSIAPFIKSKTSDPAVLVMDEKGKFVIPILSGHLGGANDLARRIAACSGALPVLTTATDVNVAFAVDEWAKKNYCRIANPGKIVKVSSKILDKESVIMYSAFPISGKVPEGIRLVPMRQKTEKEEAQQIPEKGETAHISKTDGRGTETEKEEAWERRESAEAVFLPDIFLDVFRPENKRETKQETGQPKGFAAAAGDLQRTQTSYEKETGIGRRPASGGKTPLCLIPCILVLGVGCRKGISCETLEQEFQKFLQENHLYEQAFTGAASIDLKKEEPGLLSFCEKHGWKLQTFSAEKLEQAPGRYTSSDFVWAITGTDNVCERSAVLASEGKLLVRKRAENGVTLAAAQMPFFPKWE